MNSITEVSRIFQYDYIYFDAGFLALWILVLLKNKQYKALLVGAVIAPILYTIDAGIWWSTSAGPTYPAGTFIREYWVNGLQIPHPLGSYVWLKFGADFMMTISYSLFTFPWLWMAFHNIQIRKTKNTLQYALGWLCIWLTVPLLSLLVPLQDSVVETVRHMHSQLPIWIGSTLFGYGTLCLVYKKDIGLVLKLFGIGALGALIMELPLLLFHIRPVGIQVLIFDTIFMLNQAVPWLYLLYDKVYRKKDDLNSQFARK